MRDRLIELIRKSGCVDTWNYHADDFKEPNPIYELADYLLANGVIVPNCKVGDTVYVDDDAFCRDAIFYEGCHIGSKRFVIGKVFSFIRTKKQLLMKIRVSNYFHTSYKHQRFTVNALGKTVFLTKEEAERALKGGAE